ncbi:hypothetical protein KC343_g16382 [Hortaea werneckii]|nr:hypothetical protein KC352_g28382 [Hortaea werneckii]KAI7544857.1 hypothetical protein KC317_g15893 [Hortaea werneckii]KAI7595339.1 hypothetical protein KC346_g15431 [Hortaea werneckii]KAI7598488.1 hypothetical protein KC343_g16382 [Hortaea werneckii]KAI7634224.1 hypothetical protein KC319_g15740 [Hortaea werneckii]
MPTHEEHLAGIEEATGRVRTLKARFDNVENDWCEAAKQLQKMRDLKQTWIDEYGYVPSDPLMWTLLEPSEKLYTRKAKEYLAVSREMITVISQRDSRIWKYLDVLSRESSTEEQDEPGARAERERAAHRERMRQQQSTRAAAEERQRREEAHRRRQQEEALRQRRDEQARRQARAKQEEQAKQQRSQAQQSSRKRQREQTEQEAPGQPESPKRRKSQHPEHNTTAPTLPYGALTPAEATWEWRTRFLQPWPTTYYRTLQSFPAPPPIPCPSSPCCKNPATDRSRILQTCDVYLRKTFETLSMDELRKQRVKWHPDRFSASPEERGGERAAYRKMAGEVFVVVNEVYEKNKKKKEE